MDINCGHNGTGKPAKPLQFISSLAFIMPFQPAMWDEKSIQSALGYTTHIIETKLKNSYTVECTNTMLGRVKQLFNGLNFNTHRKSIAVLISADSEKIMYLSFPVKLFVAIGNFVSVLDLVASIKQDIGFFILFNAKDNITLYDYHNKQLNKIYEQKPDPATGYFVDAAVKTSLVVTYMNTNYQKPVFIVGSTHEVNAFKSMVCYPEIIFQIIKSQAQFSTELIQSIVAEIEDQWINWLSKFHIGRIAIAKKGNKLIFNYAAVLQALCNSSDGLLLMDKKVKRELQKTGTDDNHFQESTFFISQIEKFVDRGNCIGIKQNGLLKDWGGIVLLCDTMPGHYKELSFGEHRISVASGILF